MEHYKKIESKICDIFNTALEIEAPEKAPLSKKPKKLASKITMGPGRPRPSGFPYCPVKHVYKDLTHGSETLSLRSAYYLSVGTAAHLVFQRFVALTGSVWGNYGCPKCGTFEIRKSPYCPKCSTSKIKVECEYHELEASYGAVYAHADALFDLGDDGLWIGDYKTSSLAVRGSDMLPYLKNQYQCAAYVPIFERTLNRKINGFALIYVPRDNPKKFEVHAVPMSDRMKEKSVARTLLYSKQAALADSYVKNKSRPVETLNKIIEQKLCTDHATCAKYEQTGCSLAPVCLPAKPDSNRKLIHFLTKEIQ